eukprot:8617911-Alexandrium_andersonii.AAC.1
MVKLERDGGIWKRVVGPDGEDVTVGPVAGFKDANGHTRQYGRLGIMGDEGSMADGVFVTVGVYFGSCEEERWEGRDSGDGVDLEG